MYGCIYLQVYMTSMELFQPVDDHTFSPYVCLSTNQVFGKQVYMRTHKGKHAYIL